MNSNTRHLLIVYHSQSGRNERLAYCAADAAKTEAGVEIRLRRASEAGSRDLQWADVLLLLTPENFGALAGGIKDFLDRCFYPVLEKEIQCSYAVFMCTGNDGSQALAQLQRILSGLPFRAISEPVIVRGAPDTKAFERAAELGETLAAGLSLGIF